VCALGINERNARSKVNAKSDGYLIFFTETPTLEFFYRSIFLKHSLTCSLSSYDGVEIKDVTDFLVIILYLN
jgi:hypothetical protein